MIFTVKNCSVLSALATATVAFTPQASHAATLFAGSADGVFGDPSTNALQNVFSGVDTNTFTTGNPLGTSSPNTFSVDGLSFSAEAGTLFSVANLTYTNGATVVGSNVSSVALDLTLDFATPSGIEEVTFGLDFDLVDLTTNTTGDPVLDADTLSISNVASSFSFDVGGEEFTLDLVGFSTDAGSTIDNTFTLAEGATTEAQLFGVITAPDSPSAGIPEPATIIGSLVALGLTRMMKRKS